MTSGTNIYLTLTRTFNDGRLRAVVSSGQAVVLHRLAIMSKDGDWIIREDEETTTHILQILSRHGARYRFGAPLDVRWLAQGWSAHFEFRHNQIRVRTDFVTRPPRLSRQNLARLWTEHQGNDLPFLGAADLIEIKKTNREKDYAVIGELARLLTDPAECLLYSRSAGDLVEIAAKHPDLLDRLVLRRPLLQSLSEGRETLEKELDAERRALMHANEQRLASYKQMAAMWEKAWPQISARLTGQSLLDDHRTLVAEADELLPKHVPEGNLDV